MPGLDVELRGGVEGFLRSGSEMTRYIFFSGKGGVGKTTMASATAVHYATSGIRLKNAGIGSAVCIYTMILPLEVCEHNFFRNRRQMQMKYLKEITKIFKLPVLQFPLMQDEIKGIDSLQKAMSLL